MAYKHGDIVSIPDPHETRPSRPAVIVSDGDCPDHGNIHTVTALTGSQQRGQSLRRDDSSRVVPPILSGGILFQTTM